MKEYKKRLSGLLQITQIPENNVTKIDLPDHCK